MTMTIKTERGHIEGYIDGRNWGTLPVRIAQIENLEIELEHHNLPKPLPFQPQVVDVAFLDPAGHIVYQTDSITTQLPSTLHATSARVRLRNCLYAEITFNRGSDSRFSFVYRPFWDRDIGLAYIRGDRHLEEDRDWRKFYLPPDTTLQYILKVICAPFPYLVVTILLWLILSRLRLASWSDKVFAELTLRTKQRIRRLTQAAIPIALVAFLVYLVWLMTVYVEKIPHDPDSVDYLWAAKYFAAGRLWLPIPSAFFKAHWEMNNHWISLYNYGHSLLLAAGALFGIPWLIPPLVGTIFLYVLYSFLKDLMVKSVAIAMVMIVFFSPQFQMHAVNFMSHNSAILLLMLFFYALLRICRGKANAAVSFLGGVSYSLLLQTRPLAAAVVAPIVALLALILVVRKKTELSRYSFMIMGFAVSLIIFLYINYLTYGDAIRTAHNQFNLNKFAWAQSGATISYGLTDSLSYLIVMRQIVLSGSPILFTLLVLLAIFNRRFWWLTAICIGAILAIGASTATYDDPWGIFLGTRFWHEMLPFIFVLIAVSFDLILQRLRRAGYLVVALITLLVMIRSINGWVLARENLWGNAIPFTPTNINELKGFNHTDARLIREAERQNIHNAIIFVKDCGGDWWCYGSVADENSVDLNGDILWVHDLGDRNKELVGVYPGRKAFIADYEVGTIEAYRPTAEESSRSD